MGEIASGGDHPTTIVEMKVSFLGELCPVVGRREMRVVLPSGATLAELLASLVEKYGEAFRTRTLDAQGKLRRHIVVFINGRDAKERGGLETVLGGDDVDILMLPIFEGG